MEFPTIEIAAMQKIISRGWSADQASSLFGQAPTYAVCLDSRASIARVARRRVPKRERGSLRYCEVNFPLRERLI
jgi:hypothetical protein